jgi:hypothetical protein
VEPTTTERFFSGEGSSTESSEGDE